MYCQIFKILLIFRYITIVYESSFKWNYLDSVDIDWKFPIICQIFKNFIPFFSIYIYIYCISYIYIIYIWAGAYIYYIHIWYILYSIYYIVYIYPYIYMLYSFIALYISLVEAADHEVTLMKTVHPCLEVDTNGSVSADSVCPAVDFGREKLMQGINRWIRHAQLRKSCFFLIDRIARWIVGRFRVGPELTGFGASSWGMTRRRSTVLQLARPWHNGRRGISAILCLNGLTVGNTVLDFGCLS